MGFRFWDVGDWGVGDIQQKTVQLSGFWAKVAYHDLLFDFFVYEGLHAVIAAGETVTRCRFLFLFSSAGSWGHPVLFYILALAGGILAPIAGSNAKAVLLNTVATRSRGTVFGVLWRKPSIRFCF